MFGFDLIVLLIILGILTGFLSGLLGIGGGTVIVPGLAILFHQYSVETDQYYMQFAAGSALTIMIFSSLSSVIKNYSLQLIHKPTIKPMIFWVIGSVIVGAIVASQLTPGILTVIFIAVLIYILLYFISRMYSKKSLESDLSADNLPKNKLRLGGVVMGFISGLLGLGGGIIAVPLLTKIGLPMRKAAGTSSFFALVISFVGSIIFAILGYFDPITLRYSTGYIYWPSVILIIPFAMLAAPFGVKLKARISERAVLIIFILFLTVIILKMLSLALVKLF